MKKIYGKPQAYCENHITGKVAATSAEYAEKMKDKIKTLKNAQSTTSGKKSDLEREL